MQGCIAETGLFREHYKLFRTLFPPFQKYITKGYVSEKDAGDRLAQVCSTRDPASGSRCSLCGSHRECNHQRTNVAVAGGHCCCGSFVMQQGWGLCRRAVLPVDTQRGRIIIWEVIRASLRMQVVADEKLAKSGVYWSWNDNSSSFENQLSGEASDATKAAKLWEVSERLVGLAH